MQNQMKILLASLVAIIPLTALADDYQAWYSITEKCYRTDYREEYIPGSEDNPGYVRSWKDTIEYECDEKRPNVTRRTIIERQVEVDDNSCKEGTLAGGLIGGGIAASISRGKDSWWAIPTGIVTGAMIGCDIDGG